MKSIIDLGMNNVSFFSEKLKTYYGEFTTLEVSDYIENIKGGYQQTQLKDGAIEQLVTNISLNKNENHIFLINNNLSHEVSALTSALCFKANGICGNKKVILNFDHHPDGNGKTKSEILKYSNWGNCVALDSYKDLISKGTEYSYIVTDTAKIEEIEQFTDNILNDQNTIDLYVTIDTDVYKRSYTSYGDGFFEQTDILNQLKKIGDYIKQNKGKINFCGGDVTGCPDLTSGFYNEREGKIYIGIDTIGIEKILDDANGKILKLLNCLYSMRIM